MHQPSVSSWQIKAALLLMSSLTVMAGATIAPALPEISRHFAHNPKAELLSKLILTLPALVIGLTGPFTGFIVDAFGRKRLLLFSMILYALAGTTGLYLDDLYGILTGRLFLGIAVSGIMTITTTLIGDYFSGAERNRFMGFQGAFMAFGGVVFLVTGGVLADWNWRGPFGIYFCSLLFFPLAYYYLYEPQTAKLKQGEFKFSDIKLPYQTLTIIYLTGFMVMLFFYMIPTQIPFLLKKLEGISGSETGIALGSTTLSAAFSALFYQRVRSHLNAYYVFSVMFALMGIGFMIVAYSQGYFGIILGLVTVGIGAGFSLPNTNVALIEIAPEALRGRMVGLLTMAFFLGQFFSPLIIQPIAGFLSLHSIFFFAGNLMVLIGLGFVWLGKGKQEVGP